MATINVPGRCHFDSDGWLQGPIRITHMTALTPNRYNSGFADKARGMVQHTEDGFEAGTVETFMNPARQVSAFFSVDELGNAHQYLPVGHGYVAWAEGEGNPDWRSCEAEDKTRTGDPMPPPQVTAMAQILEALSEYDGFPLALTGDPVNGRGLITHGAGGVRWGNHPNCPGSVRKAQGAHVVALAISIRQGGGTAPKSWTAAGQLSLSALCNQHLGEDVAAVLATTARNSPGAVFAADLASYVNAAFSADSGKCPAGVTWAYPGKGGMAATWKTEGQMSLSALAANLKTRPAVMVQMTADVAPGGKLAANAAGYINEVFAASSLHVPAGVVLLYGSAA